jgi:putative intracellular protease/amidase
MTAEAQNQKVIAFVLYPGLTALDMIGPLQVFRSLQRLDPRFQPVVVGARVAPMDSDTQLRMIPDKSFDEVPHPSVLIVPGGLIPTFKAMSNPAIRRYVRRAAETAEVVGSVCTGALILAAVGLLEGRPATTHWACTKVLEKVALAGDPDGYPGKDEVAEYLEANARHFDLPVLLGTGIQVLARHNGGFRATTDDGARIEARAVVLATGAFQTPAISRLAAGLAADVRQFTAETYRNAARLPPGTTLVVGDGATGRDIAHDVQGTGSHTVILATGRRRRLLAERILGRSTWW